MTYRLRRTHRMHYTIQSSCVANLKNFFLYKQYNIDIMRLLKICIIHGEKA